MIKVHDERLVRLIALGKKTVHRFPSRFRHGTSELTHPKISPGVIHKVYTQAPFGRDGNPDARPLLEVMILSVEAEPLGDINHEEANLEGFATTDAFIRAWNAVYTQKAIRFAANMYHPVWRVEFELEKILPDGQKMIDKIEKKIRSSRRGG